VVDRNFGILKLAVLALMPNTQLRNLTDAAGNWTLVALVTGLPIEERTKAIRDRFDLLKFGLVCFVRRLVCDSITDVIEAGRRLKQL
jgi:hypothetical protein